MWFNVRVSWAGHSIVAELPQTMIGDWLAAVITGLAIGPRENIGITIESWAQ